MISDAKLSSYTGLNRSAGNGEERREVENKSVSKCTRVFFYSLRRVGRRPTAVLRVNIYIYGQVGTLHRERDVWRANPGSGERINDFSGRETSKGCNVCIRVCMLVAANTRGESVSERKTC
jgi:hypothetical protein